MGFWKLRKSTINFVMSVCMEQLVPHCTPFHKNWYFNICQNMSRNFKFHYNLKRLSYTLLIYIDNFMIIIRLIIVRKINISCKICIESQTTHFVFKNFYFRKSCFLLDQATDDCSMVHGLCVWLNKATNTHSEYTIVTALLQQWLHEHASMSRYTYFACLMFVTRLICWLISYSY